MSIIDTLGVIGMGKVGQAIYNLFKDNYTVYNYDKNKQSDSIGVMKKCDYAVVAVPTPMAPDGSCDISHISDVFREFSSSIDHFLIKSAIPPGTSKSLADHYSVEVVVSPEFIGEGSYEVPFWRGYPDPEDISKHQFQIFGGPRKETNRWVEIFQKVMGPEPEYYQTDWKTAELTKYIENTWIAAKVTFVNEMFEIAEAFNVDFRELRELWLADGRVSRMHTAVFEGDRGFGGRCLPKDVNALISVAEKREYQPDLLKEVLATNEKIREEQD